MDAAFAVSIWCVSLMADLSTTIGQLLVGAFSLTCDHASTIQLPKERISKHTYCGRGTSGSTENYAK